MLNKMLRDGPRRRSPRILAIGTCKENRQEKKPVQQYFRRFKRKSAGAAENLTSTSTLNKQVWKGRDNTQDDDHLTEHVEWRSICIPEIMEEHQKCGDQAIRNGKPSAMPAKHVLELVLDTLQKRDDYDIFEEPVDRDEVEDYYEIIKEPMDFGTMRAKLHEGMYENLEQFEHDVFLIPENAMFFNSSATVYYGQAQAIHELAQKVFDSLKTDPENFELEFSVTRRRSMRKAWSDVACKQAVRTQPGSSTVRRASKKNRGCSGRTNRFRPRNSSTGNTDGGLSNLELTGRRFTYWKPGSPFNSKAKDVGSSFYSGSQSLVLINQGEISYEDSLMSFVKDLGPIAQMVAKRKLSWQNEPNSTTQSEKNLFSTTPQRKRDSEDSVKATLYRKFSDIPSGTPPCFKISKTIDLNKDGEGESSSRHGRIGFGIPLSNFGLPRKEVPGFSTLPKERNDFGALGKQKLDFYAMTANEITKQRISSKEKTDSIARGKKKLDRPITLPEDQETVARTRRRKDVANSDQDFRPVILALENPHRSKATGYKPRNKKNLAQMPCNLTSETKAAEKGEGSSLPQATSPFVSQQCMFGVPFVKSRLSLMSNTGREGFLSPAGGSGDYQQKRPWFDINEPYVPGQSSSMQSLDSLETSLALRL